MTYSRAKTFETKALTWRHRCSAHRGSGTFADSGLLDTRRGHAGQAQVGQWPGVAVARAAAFGSKVIILISHNVQHVFEVADRIDVHRLGKRLCVIDPKEHSMPDAVSYMAGAKEPAEVMVA